MPGLRTGGNDGGRKRGKKRGGPFTKILLGTIVEDFASFLGSGKGVEDLLSGIMSLVDKDSLDTKEGPELLKTALAESKAGKTTAWCLVEKLATAEGEAVRRQGEDGLKTRTGAGAMSQEDKYAILESAIGLALRGDKCRKEMSEVFYSLTSEVASFFLTDRLLYQI
jgi:hypothetical protein